jgi:benzil reductase ((S)-benzoin forming)
MNPHSADPSVKLALVTGTTSGTGVAVARLLIEGTWAVVGVARRAPQIEHPRYQHLALDLADVATTVATLERDVTPRLADRQWERVALVNNAASPGPLTSVEQIDPLALLPLYAVNVAAPVWLMGFLLRTCPPEAAVRVVNVSSAAATQAFPGLAAYGGSKAALRMAGMVLAAELDSPLRRRPAPADVAILSYEPGLVDTPMQALARSQAPESFPSAQMFRDFESGGLLVPAEAPAAEIVAFLEGDAQARFSERRFGRSV